MIRHTFLSLLFAVLFVFAQQQAMLHSYVHTADWQQKSSGDKQAPKHSEVCGKCVALSNIGHTVTSQSHAFNVASGQFELSTSSHLSIASESFVPYHSRAPPYLA
jgi:Protein of unknown function (DUF2946)